MELAQALGSHHCRGKQADRFFSQRGNHDHFDLKKVKLFPSSPVGSFLFSLFIHDATFSNTSVK